VTWQSRYSRSPGISRATGTTINIYQAPQWLKIQAVIFRELQPYPDIRVRLAEALKEVEDS